MIPSMISMKIIYIWQFVDGLCVLRTIRKNVNVSQPDRLIGVVNDALHIQTSHLNANVIFKKKSNLLVSVASFILFVCL